VLEEAKEAIGNEGSGGNNTRDGAHKPPRGEIPGRERVQRWRYDSGARGGGDAVVGRADEGLSSQSKDKEVRVGNNRYSFSPKISDAFNF